MLGLNTARRRGQQKTPRRYRFHRNSYCLQLGEATDANRDAYAELKELGKDRIAQIIPTLSDGVLLQDDKRLDVPKLKQLLDEMNWSGWLVLQLFTRQNKAPDVKYNFSANATYLKSIFQA